MISKKKIKEIENESVFVDVLKEMTEGFDKWTENSPEFWLSEETLYWDIASEVERRLKEKILEKLKIKEK